MAVSVQQEFASNPSVLRQGIIEILRENRPGVLDLLIWEPESTRASGSQMGASFALELRGEGPTVLIVRGSITGMAALMYSEETAKSAITANRPAGMAGAARWDNHHATVNGSIVALCILFVVTRDRNSRP